MGRTKRVIKACVWRLRNRHNETRLVGDHFPLGKVKVGKATYGPIHAISFGSPNEGLKIGSYCSIADDVTFLLGGGHALSSLSTYPFRAKYIGCVESQTKGQIVIDDDVWIGYGATIMSGVHLGQGCVVGARSLVTKDIPPYAIVGGVPARIIRYRFEEDLRKRLIAFDFSKLSDEFIKEHILLLENQLSQNIVDVIEHNICGD